MYKRQQLANALRNALHKDPAKRSDARQFGQELEAFIKGSKEIATSMELGAWLTEQVPPTEILSSRDTTAIGTGPATAATVTDRPSAPNFPEAMVFANPGETQARGSVHAAKQVAARSLSVVGVARQSSASAPTIDEDENTVVVQLRDSDDDETTIQSAPAAPSQPRQRRHGTGPLLRFPPNLEIVPTDLSLGGPTIQEASKTPTDFAATTIQEPTTDDEKFTSIVKVLPDSALPPNSHLPTQGSFDFSSTASIDSPTLLQPPQQLSRVLMFTAALVLAIVGGLAAYLIMTSNSTRASSLQPGDDAGQPIPIVTPLPDGGPEFYLDAAPIAPDAMPPEGEPADKRKRRSRKRSQVGKQYGHLMVHTNAETEIYQGRKKLGVTPTAGLRLPEGRYTLSFKNADFATATRRVSIEAGKTTKLSFALGE